jgi:hypothetical protein
VRFEFLIGSRYPFNASSGTCAGLISLWSSWFSTRNMSSYSLNMILAFIKALTLRWKILERNQSLGMWNWNWVSEKRWKVVIIVWRKQKWRNSAAEFDLCCEWWWRERLHLNCWSIYQEHNFVFIYEWSAGFFVCEKSYRLHPTIGTKIILWTNSLKTWKTN